MTQIYDRHLAATGLKATQYSILAILDRRGSLSIGELAAAMVMDRTTMGRAVQPLARDGLVRIEIGADARSRAVRLSRSGKSRFTMAKAAWRAAQDQVEGAYGSAAAAQLRATLARLVGVLEHPAA